MKVAYVLVFVSALLGSKVYADYVDVSVLNCSTSDAKETFNLSYLTNVPLSDKPVVTYEGDLQIGSRYLLVNTGLTLQPGDTSRQDGVHEEYSGSTGESFMDAVIYDAIEGSTNVYPAVVIVHNDGSVLQYNMTCSYNLSVQ